MTIWFAPPLASLGQKSVDSILWSGRMLNIIALSGLGKKKHLIEKVLNIEDHVL